MNDKNYWAVRDEIVNNADTKQTMQLVVDLLGNIIDLKEEKIEEDINNLELYHNFRIVLFKIIDEWKAETEKIKKKILEEQEK